MKIRRFVIIALTLAIALAASVYLFRGIGSGRPAPEAVSPAEDFRPRTIITTDGECDDLNSFIHLLYCSNDLDIRGIVLTSSCYHYGGETPYRWAGEDWMFDYISAYGEVYVSLAERDASYPAPEYLAGITRIGNISAVNDVAASTDGSLLIADEILKNEDSTLYIQCWGGSNTVARALMDIEEQFGKSENWSEMKSELSARIVIYLVSTQDDTYESYIKPVWPEITVLHSVRGFEALAFGWKWNVDKAQAKTLHAGWQLENIIRKNPLAEKYCTYWDEKAYVGELPQYQYGLTEFNLPKYWRILTYHGGIFSYGDFLSEGDSPAFLFLLDGRLENIDSYEISNWGGTFRKVSEHYYVDDFPPADTIGRYLTAINEDFAARIGS
ncbi:MAG: DUF1593 domain-containing protein [Oscillospiraceae bacterium]|nr:DUF1593 domain-containing protein [Oscillospiraceae bacterium]